MDQRLQCKGGFIVNYEKKNSHLVHFAPFSRLVTLSTDNFTKHSTEDF